VRQVDRHDRDQHDQDRDGVNDRQLVGAEEVAEDPDRQGFFAGADREGGVADDYGDEAGSKPSTWAAY
jgi:hypothetical protein